jgi:hypothetical protein
MFNEEMFDGSAFLSLEFLDLEAWGQGLLQLLGLLLIFDDKCVQEARASDLKKKKIYKYLYLSIIISNKLKFNLLPTTIAEIN